MQMPGMMPMDTTFQPNRLMQQGMGILNMARGQRQPQPGAQGGLLQRLLTPPAQPTDLAAPGMPSNPMQMGMLSRLFPALAQQQPMIPQGNPTGGLGGLY